jgi:hypothetical protein
MGIPDNVKLEVLRKIAFGDLAGARTLLEKYNKKEENKNGTLLPR